MRLRYALLSLIIPVVIAIPLFRRTLQRSREFVLKNQLTTLRLTIDEYTFDKQSPPKRLENLVEAGYLREIPIDPMTSSDRTWRVTIKSWGRPNMPGIYDVQSGSSAKGLDGGPYSEW